MTSDIGRRRILLAATGAAGRACGHLCRAAVSFERKSWSHGTPHVPLRYDLGDCDLFTSSKLGGPTPHAQRPTVNHYARHCSLVMPSRKEDCIGRLPDKLRTALLRPGHEVGTVSNEAKAHVRQRTRSSLSILRSSYRNMAFGITPEWVAGLRRDVKTWDFRVVKGCSSLDKRHLWEWPNMTPPLKYAGSEADLVGI